VLCYYGCVGLVLILVYSYLSITWFNTSIYFHFHAKKMYLFTLYDIPSSWLFLVVPPPPVVYYGIPWGFTPVPIPCLAWLLFPSKTIHSEEEGKASPEITFKMHNSRYIHQIRYIHVQHR